MYTQSEILTIARHCTSVEEVMEASKLFRELIKDGVQSPSMFLNYIFIKRIREIVA